MKKCLLLYRIAGAVYKYVLCYIKQTPWNIITEKLQHLWHKNHASESFVIMKPLANEQKQWNLKPKCSEETQKIGCLLCIMFYILSSFLSPYTLFIPPSEYLNCVVFTKIQS